MEDVESSTLVQALHVARRRWLLLLLTPLIAAVVGYGAAKARTPSYEATAILLAGHGGTAVGSFDQVQSANEAALALGAMASDRVVVEHALRSLGLRSGVASLRANTTISVPQDSQKIEVTVTDPNPARAVSLANAIAESFADLVEDKQATRFNLGATVWQHAVLPTSPVAPNVPLATFAAFVIGLLLGAALAFVRESLDATWRSERDVELDLDQVVLAVIPEIRARHRRSGALA